MARAATVACVGAAVFVSAIYFLYVRGANEPSGSARVYSVLCTLDAMAGMQKLTVPGNVPAASLPADPARNDFPALVNALGPEITRSVLQHWGPPFRLVVLGPGAAPTYTDARDSEAVDPAIDKWLLDFWGAPLIYRPNRKADGQLDEENPLLLYSRGPNGIDEGGHGDDLRAE